MNVFSLKCPNCGASLALNSNIRLSDIVCEYCGQKLVFDDGVQHVQYDNMASAGYEFERGRQQAKREYRSYQQPPQPIIINNTYIRQPVRKHYSLLLDLFMICITCGLWIIHMVRRPKYE